MKNDIEKYFVSMKTVENLANTRSFPVNRNKEADSSIIHYGSESEIIISCD